MVIVYVVPCRFILHVCNTNLHVYEYMQMATEHLDTACDIMFLFCANFLLSIISMGTGLVSSILTTRGQKLVLNDVAVAY